jgi:dihydrofolate reductase
VRALNADLFITLDGYAKGDESPAFFGLLGPDLERWIAEQADEPHLMVMGRVTYETLRGYDDGTTPLARAPKVMVSRSVTEADWGETQVVASDEELVALKEQDGPSLRVVGSVSLVQRLLRAGGIDRLRLLVFPLILGETGSEPTFADLPDLSLELVGSEVLDGRLVLLDYRPGA